MYEYALDLAFVLTVTSSKALQPVGTANAEMLV